MELLTHILKLSQPSTSIKSIPLYTRDLHSFFYPRNPRRKMIVWNCLLYSLAFTSTTIRYTAATITKLYWIHQSVKRSTEACLEYVPWQVKEMEDILIPMSHFFSRWRRFIKWTAKKPLNFFSKLRTA